MTEIRMGIKRNSIDTSMKNRNQLSARKTHLIFKYVHADLWIWCDCEDWDGPAGEFQQHRRDSGVFVADIARNQKRMEDQRLKRAQARL